MKALGVTAGKIAVDYLKTLGKPDPVCLFVSRPTSGQVSKDRSIGFSQTVLAAFPKARIIYLQRDPIDTCLSCYFQQFPPALNWSMDLGDLAYYYRESRRLMAHWLRVLPPGTILEVPYMELVADPEKWTRRILEFIGLPWDERCLDFYKTTRAVNTASVWQVRQKIYMTSVQRWRNYEKFIGPLHELEGLG